MRPEEGSGQALECGILKEITLLAVEFARYCRNWRLKL